MHAIELGDQVVRAAAGVNEGLRATDFGQVDDDGDGAVGGRLRRQVQAVGAQSQYHVGVTCCRLALPHMRRQRWGKIVNMGTIATELPVASQNKYITAKSAIVGYTRSLATEVAVDNIQVNLVAPSMTETSLIASLPAALVKRLAEDSADRALLAPIEVAKVVLFLVSNWSTSVSGQQVVLAKGAPPFL